MRWRCVAAVTLGAVAFSPPPLPAQQELLQPFRLEDGTPVPRGIPVPRPGSTSAPAATPVPVAPPLATPPPRPVPAPAAPPPKATTPRAPEVPDPGGEIRFTPSGTSMTADQMQLSIADSYYSRQMFEMAAPEYERYLGLYGSGNPAGRQTALFRLAESYRRTGTLNAATTTYETLLSEYTEGEFIGAAAYRLAEIYYQDRQFRPALPLFRRAAVKIKDVKLANSAKFFVGRCLEGMALKYEARGIYEDLVANPKENPFVDASRLSLAVLLKEANRTSEALKQIQVLAAQTEHPELKAEASVRAGLWMLELGQAKKAEETLEAALKLPGLGAWKEMARVGLFQMQFNAARYKELIASYWQSATEFSPQVRPQLLVLVANAHRQLNQQAEALALYNEVLRDAPSSASAKEAAYERLVCLYQIDSENILPEIQQFLDVNSDSPKRDHALLMKAEVLFKKQDYASAIPVYDMLDRSRNLSGDLKGKALFKLGWCHLQTKDNQGAIKTFTSLVQDFPSSDSVAAALFHRGVARLRLNDLKGAAKDFDQVITRLPKCKEREPALEQKALILGKLDDNAGMAETYKLLLKDYPNTRAAADGNYWIGWVAFENKDYKNAAGPLDQARKLDKERYFERASLRILLGRYYTEEWDALGQEIDLYGREGGKGQVPEEVLRGTATHYFDVAERASRAGDAIDVPNFSLAGKYFAAVTSRDDAKPEDFLRLGQSRYFLGQYAESTAALMTYLQSVRDRPARATGLLTLARSQIALKELDAAQKSVDEAISLQADGKVNAEARISWGDIEMARGRFDGAGKTYESVSVIIDDEEVTPRALEKAIKAYEKSGRETDAKRLMNTLKSRYPEYYQGSKKPR